MIRQYLSEYRYIEVLGGYYGSGLTVRTYGCGRDNSVVKIILTRATKGSSILVEQEQELEQDFAGVFENIFEYRRCVYI